MANKLYAMEQLTEEVAKDIAAKPEEWMRFLDTASRLYKYTFDVVLCQEKVQIKYALLMLSYPAKASALSSNAA